MSSFADRLTAALIPEKTYSVTGSWGTLVVDVGGHVIEVLDNEDADEDNNYHDIAQVDVVEYAQHYGRMEDTDILLIGYWDSNGAYEEPEHSHRELIANGG